MTHDELHGWWLTDTTEQAKDAAGGRSNRLLQTDPVSNLAPGPKTGTDLASTDEESLIRYQRPESPTETVRFSVLASGSSGNSIYVETDQCRVLVDAGLSGKKIESLLASINRQASDLDAILVTHEHSDHIKGVGILSRRYHLPVYANAATWQAMEASLGKIDADHRRYIEPDQLFSLKNLDIQTFNVSHDAANPMFYAFQRADRQLVLMTDTGYVSDRLRDQFKNANAYLIESNHEIEMLRYGSYPWHLKQRILSDLGHLSNEDGALALTDLIGNKTKHVYLGHLSKENNTKDLSMQQTREILQRYDFGVGQDFRLHMTDPDSASPLQDL